MNPFTPARSAAAAVLLLAITLPLGHYALSLRADPGIESLIPSGGASATRLADPGGRFGSGETLVIALRSRRLFTREGLAALDDLTQKAERLPHVSRVLSPTNVRDLDGDELGPFETVPYEKVLSGRATPEEFGRAMAAHPLFSGLLVSTDASTAALLLETEAEGAGADHRAMVVRAARELAAGAPAGFEAYVAGLPVEKVDLAALVERDQRVFAPIIVAMLMVVAALLYRHPAGVIVPLSVVGGSLLWTLGLYGAAGRALNPITSLLTPVVLVVSVEGAVHLMNHHLVARAEGLAREAALARAVRRSWIPCFNAALTTAIGFVSLVLLPIPAIRDFGAFTAIGVMVSYLLTMTLAPLLLAWLPDVPPRQADRFRPGGVEGALKTVAGWVCRRPAPAAAVSLAVLIASAVGVARIRVETDIIGSLRQGTALRRATTFIDRNLTGVNALGIIANDVSPDDPGALLRLADFERDVRSMPGVRKVMGLPDLYARANRAFHGGDDTFERLPEGEQGAADLADIHDLIQRSAGAELARFVAPGGGDGQPAALRLEARVTAMGSAASQDLFRRVREAASRRGLGAVSLTGSFVALSDMSTNLVRNQIRGLVPALALILTAMAVQFRSARLGLLCLIPNGAPVLMVYGVMGWAGIALSVPTAMIASIAIGMTVDNTIHLLARFREEYARGGDYVRALDTMLDTTGRAVVFSTVTLAAGFWVGAFSSFLPSVHFAVLTGAALLLGLVSEIFLLPLTMILFAPFGRARGAQRAVLCLAVALLAGAPGTAAAGGGLALKDQHGRADAPSLHRGRVVVLFYGKAAGLRRMKAWELKLKELSGAAEPGYDVLRAVDARGVKGKRTEAEVDERLRRNVPPEVSILIDWDGALADAYALPDADVALTVIDPKGRHCGTTGGPVRDDALRQVFEVIERVKKKGSCA